MANGYIVNRIFHALSTQIVSLNHDSCDSLVLQIILSSAVICIVILFTDRQSAIATDILINLFNRKFIALYGTFLFNR